MAKPQNYTVGAAEAQELVGSENVKKIKSENNGSPPKSNWTYCVKCVHFKISVLLLVYH